MFRAYNFSAGPATLPTSVLQQAQQEMLDWQGTGMSIMEMSHRGKDFIAIAQQAGADLRDLLQVPDDYDILFLQGGATGQFAAVPLNLLGDKQRVDYFNTGEWSKKAIKEAKQYAQVNLVSDSSANKFTTIADPSTWQFSPDAAYVHYTPNETINGLEFHNIPETNGVTLVADMSSTILSRPIDVSKFGLIYAGAQKNIGPAGVTVVIVRKDLIGRESQACPSILNYQVNVKDESMHNTPPTYAWYLAGLVFKWLKNEIGGVEKMAIINQRKAAKLYSAIDSIDFYHNPVDPAYRSWMNVPFTLAEPKLEAAFITESWEAGLTNLAGHRSVGGMRASIYNAMPEAGIDALINFMQDFAQRKA